MLNMADSRFHTLRIHRPFFQRPQNLPLMFFIFHVNEIDDNEAAQVS